MRRKTIFHGTAALAGLWMTACATQVSATDIGIGVGDIGVGVGVGFGNGDISADVDVDAGDLGADVSVGAGPQGLGADVDADVAGVDVDAAVGIGTGGVGVGVGVGPSSPTGPSPSGPGTPDVSNPNAPSVASTSGGSGRSGMIRPQDLVGLVLMSSDRQLLGIVQGASWANRGYMLDVQVNAALGLNREQVTLQLPTATPRNGRIFLGAPLNRIKASF